MSSRLSRLVTRTAQIGVAVAASLGLSVSLAPAASATSPIGRAPLPVPHQFLAGAVDQVTAPGGDLAGANDWSCKPDPSKPRPVVLVHGTSGGAATNWATYGPLLHNEGYCVYTLTYGALPGTDYPLSELGGLSSIPDVSVPQVSRFVDRVLESTGADQVDLVGHSQGTLVSADVAKRGRPGRVHSVVSIAPLWDGTGGAGVRGMFEALPGYNASVRDTFPPGAQMSTGSEYLRGLFGAENTPYRPGVRYTNLVTRYDQFIMPFTSGILAAPAGDDRYSVRNVVVQDGCEQDYSEHLAIAASPRAADMVLGALDPANAPPVRCELVLPIAGPAPSS